MATGPAATVTPAPVATDTAATEPVATDTAATEPVATGPAEPVSVPIPRARGGRIPIQDVAPVLDAGLRPVKAVPGEAFEVSATVFREGHDSLAAEVVLVGPDGAEQAPVRMLAGVPGTDRYHATVAPDRTGDWTYLVQAWGDPWATWLHVAGIKIPAGIDVELTFTEGALLFRRAAAERPADAGAAQLLRAADLMGDSAFGIAERLAVATGTGVRALLAAHPVRDLLTRSTPLPLRVSRPRALTGSWYEFFPRSIGAAVDPATGALRSGTFAQAQEGLERAAAMGFDVVYLPPVHPIGVSYRKGPNNTLSPGPHDVGSPWAIGSADGGHDAIHPELGTFEDFDAFVARAGQLGLEIALDFALQASPDHPWVTEHPEWFSHRADGSIAYAENPPKKYQDIYPIAFDEDFDGLVAETVRLLRLWMSHGVRIFRVDNPHTKPILFWETVLAEVYRTDPDVVFLSEAFTRPAMMAGLAGAGFHQSYSYFTWRNAKWEVEAYLTEVCDVTSHVLRPNFFVNTPDILPTFLQTGGPAAFAIRAVLAATAAPSWGVYSGFELFESTGLRPGGEDYLDSEKFQLRPRDFALAEAEGRSLVPLITALNRVRHEHPALQQLRGLVLHSSPDDAVVAYSRTVGDDTVLTVLTLDPAAVRETVVELDLVAMGLVPGQEFEVRDELSGEVYRWGARNFVRLDPGVRVGHVLTVLR